MIHNMEKNVPKYESIQQDVTTGDHSESDEDISNGNANGNPFIAHFEGIIEEVLLYNTEIDEDSMEEESITHDANRSYCPEFFNFLKSYLHEMPLWSGVLLGSLDRYQLTLDRDDLQDYPYLSFKSANAKTEGYIECAMRNLKQDYFPGRSRLRPDAFVLENYQRIRRRGNDYGDRIASKRGQKRKKNNERIESTRRDVKKQKVNGNKKKENKFEAKERHEKFSKPAKNPAVKVKDLSNSDQNAETEKNYSTVQETWGKKDPLTPKRDPKIGQFQQSPPIPLSKKNNERIESTRRDVKKQKVNGNKKKENKFEAKERHEKFSKPAKNPAVKVKDLSNSDQNAETEKNYSTVQETWGKKDPLTPKRDPKIGQFQQSPPIPLSKKNNERIESTRRDVKKHKVNGNKKKENKFEAKERREKFSKPAKNPAVKVKDLSNSDQNAETENNYSTVQETWGKKDPLTPKRNPKIGQFQQSPTIPLSKTPDVKKKNNLKKKPSSAFFNFLHSRGKKH